MAFTDVFRKANYSIENNSTMVSKQAKKLVSIEEAMLSIVPVAYLFLVFQIMIEDCLLICEDKACLTPQNFFALSAFQHTNLSSKLFLHTARVSLLNLL